MEASIFLLARAALSPTKAGRGRGDYSDSTAAKEIALPGAFYRPTTPVVSQIPVLEKVNIRHSVRRQSAAPAGGQNSTRRVVLTEHVGVVDGEAAASRAPGGIPRIPAGCAAGEPISGYRRDGRRRLRLRGGACGIPSGTGCGGW